MYLCLLCFNTRLFLSWNWIERRALAQHDRKIVLQKIECFLQFRFIDNSFFGLEKFKLIWSFPRNKMQHKMTALLSCGVAVCDEKRVAKKEHAFFHCCGKLFCSRKKMFKNRRRNQGHDRIMFFRHNEQMSFRGRVDIKNGKERSE